MTTCRCQGLRRAVCGAAPSVVVVQSGAHIRCDANIEVRRLTDAFENVDESLAAHASADAKAPSAWKRPETRLRTLRADENVAVCVLSQ